MRKSFCESQLESSGLTIEDVMVKSLDAEGNTTLVPAFRKGGMDKYFNINFVDDDMLIMYYDLNGRPMQYATRGAAGAKRDYVRVRWSVPELHLSIDDRPIKYQTPKGAPTQFYIPQYIRNLYLSGTHIETLIIQEGEKKAEKACKHGIPSIGIQGIYNIGNSETGLIKELQYIARECSVKNIVLLMDSDWDHLHSNIAPGDSIDQRPNQFAKAVIKFKNYVNTLNNAKIYCDVYFAHINENEAGDKGIDDLLCNTLKGKEETLKSEIEEVMNTHDGKGTYVDIHKISSITDHQIRDYWCLNNRDDFFRKYRKYVDELKEFRFGKVMYRVDGEKIIAANRYVGDIDFWKFETNEKTGKVRPAFVYRAAMAFLSGNGFTKIYNDTSKEEIFAIIDSGVVRETKPSRMRDFVYRYAESACKNEDVLEMLTEKLGVFLSSDKLERLPVIEDNFDNYEAGIQRIYYKNGQLDITCDTIEFGNIKDIIWENRVLKRKFKRVNIFSDVHVEKDEYGNDYYIIDLTDEGQKCEFLKFLANTSNFWHKEGYIPTQEDDRLFAQHLINKITCIGYLLTDFKNESELKAVVAMDGNSEEVGKSKGRSGKSLVAYAIKTMCEQITIDGKGLKNDDDFMFGNVTTRTRNVNIDDVRVNFDFARLFSAVTGDLTVNPKMSARYIIPVAKSPKIFISTNHAIKDLDDSARARIAFMSFSPWYNIKHQPEADFGHKLWTDWDDDQWNLFDNFMAECVQIYFKSIKNGWAKKQGCGIIEPPMEELRLKILRQNMSEAFLQWAEVYFDPSANHLNVRENRQDMYNAFHATFPDRKYDVTPSSFRSKMDYYCEYKGFHINPRKKHKTLGISFSEWISKPREGVFIGERDASGGKEFFQICTTEFASKQPY